MNEILDLLAPSVRTVAAILLNGLWESALLVFAVGALLRFWPRVNASTRYVTWLLTLAAVFAVPIVSTLAVGSPARVAQQSVLHVATRPVVRPPRSSAPTPHRNALHTRTRVVAAHPQLHRSSHPVSAAHPARSHRPIVHRQVPALAPVRATADTPAKPAFSRMRFTIPTIPAFVIVTLWLIAALVFLTHLAVGLLRLERLKQNATPLPVDYRDALENWNAIWKGSREIRLCVSDETQVPIAVGLFDSMILIPSHLLEILSQAEIDQVMLHEFAHLRRADDWTNCVQRVLLALLSFSPAAHFVSHQLDLEREVACDDDVLAATGAVRRYAQCLTRMVEVTIWPYAPMAAPGVFASRRGISLRVERLLHAGRNATTSLSAAPTVAVVALLGTLTFVIRLVAPVLADPILPAPVVQTPLHTSVAQRHVPKLSARPTTGALPYPVIARVTATPSAAPAHTPKPLPKPSPKPSPKNASAKRVHPATSAAQLLELKKESIVAALASPTPAAAHRTPSPLASPGYENPYHPAVYPPVVRGQVSQPGYSTPAYPIGYSGRGVCRNCDLKKVDWSGRDLHSDVFYDVRWDKANLRNTNFSNSYLISTVFAGANLQGANFREAQLSGNCDFSGADLTGADFTGASLTGCIFHGTVMGSDQAREILAACKTCSFSHIDLRGIDLHGIALTHTDFESVDLRHANLAGAQLYFVNFTGSRLEAADLSGATLNNVVFSHAKLSGINFKDATLSQCVLTGVNLTHVDLSRATLVGMDLLGRPLTR